MDAQRIRIGNQTSCHVPARVPYEFALRQGFDAFEWFSDKGSFSWCERDMGPQERAQLRQESQTKGLLFSVHAPHDADPVSSLGAEAIRQSIQFGGDVGAGVVNLHLFPQHGGKLFAAALRPLLELARSVGARLSLENTPLTSPGDFNDAFHALAAMPESRGIIGMCLDSGHANLFAGTRNDFLRYVDLLGQHIPIIHWHAHENWGDRDSHLPLFTGPSGRDDTGLRGLIRRLRQREFCGSVVLEQWPQPPEVLVQARKRLRELIDTV